MSQHSVAVSSPASSRFVGPSRPNRDDPLSQLPKYEEPFLPLDKSVIPQFNKILEPFKARTGISEHISKSLELLTDAGADCAKYKLEEECAEIELWTRNLIDMDQEITFIVDSLKEAKDKYAAAAELSPQHRQAQRNEDDGEEDEQEDDELRMVQGQGPSGLLQFRTAELKDAYDVKSLRDKYSQHVKYISLRRTLHDNANPGVPMPPASRWFTSSDRPVSQEQHDNGAEQGEEVEDDDDSDMDLQETRAVINTNCPITLRPFEKPVRSTKCPHTFEESAITDMIRRAPGRPGPGRVKTVACPVAGCGVKELSLDDLREDRDMLRHMRAAREKALMEGAELSEANIMPEPIDSDEDEEVDVTPKKKKRLEALKKIKRESQLAQQIQAPAMGSGNDVEMISD